MDFSALADDRTINKTLQNLSERGIQTELLETSGEALDRIRKLIPPGATLSTAGSVTLKEIGFEDVLKSNDHGWNNLKEQVLNEKDPVRQNELRKQSTLADYFLGSIHAVTEEGEVLTVSATGSQITSYAFSSTNVIWVVGAQKIVPTLADAFRRVKEYIFPLADRQMLERTGGKIGGVIGRYLIYENEPAWLGRNVRLLLVKEKLGF